MAKHAARSCHSKGVVDGLEAVSVLYHIYAQARAHSYDITSAMACIAHASCVHGRYISYTWSRSQPVAHLGVGSLRFPSTQTRGEAEAEGKTISSNHNYKPSLAACTKQHTPVLWVILRAGHCAPDIVCRSEPQMVAMMIRQSISPGAGSGSAMPRLTSVSAALAPWNSTR